MDESPVNDYGSATIEIFARLQHDVATGDCAGGSVTIEIFARLQQSILCLKTL